MIGPDFPAIVNDALLTASIFTLMVMQILMYVSIKRSTATPESKPPETRKRGATTEG